MVCRKPSAAAATSRAGVGVPGAAARVVIRAAYPRIVVGPICAGKMTGGRRKSRNWHDASWTMQARLGERSEFILTLPARAEGPLGLAGVRWRGSRASREKGGSVPFFIVHVSGRSASTRARADPDAFASYEMAESMARAP